MNNMSTQRISFETANLAKKKSCHLIPDLNLAHSSDLPTQSRLQKWVRDVFSIHITMDYGSLSKKWMVTVQYMEDNDVLYESDLIFETFEQALEKGLQETLK